MVFLIVLGLFVFLVFIMLLLFWFLGFINDNFYNVDLVVFYFIVFFKKDFKNRFKVEVEIKEGYVYLLWEFEGFGFWLVLKVGRGNKG